MKNFLNKIKLFNSSNNFILRNTSLIFQQVNANNLLNRKFFSTKPISKKIIGIDLGTTNSCVAIAEGNSAKVIENNEGMRTLPSFVAFSEDGNQLVGLPAKRQVYLIIIYSNLF